VTVPSPTNPHSGARRRLDIRRRHAVRLAAAALLGVGAALLVSCGTSGSGLIPADSAGPLEGDFQAVAQAAREGDGDCTATEAAVHTMESDFHKLPTTVDAGLRGRLEEGVTHLSAHALTLCAQPLAQATATTGTSTTAKPPRTTPTTTTTTGTQTTSTISTGETPPTSTTGTGETPPTTAPTGTGGGTAAPSGEGRSGEGKAGSGQEGSGGGQSGAGTGGGTGVGEAGQGQGADPSFTGPTPPGQGAGQ
jgi:hypothetical protein